MTHKVHPYGHRLGILRDWRSRWFAVGDRYRDCLKADVLMRQYLEKRLRGLHVSAIEMERGQNFWRVIIKTSRPGLLIGRNGEGAVKLKNDLLRQLKRLRLVWPREVRLDIEEVHQPESHAAIAGYLIAEGLEKRLSFRRVMKQVADKIMANKTVKGVRIDVSGRLGGTEIARKESLKQGQLPLQTLRADIDFARVEAFLPYGVIGIKVWAYRGEVLADDKLNTG